jgi:LmbE family N-acetylglucosaminyl deacetylase
MTGSKSALLAVFAHPDDETFRTGGTLALLAQRGIKVHVLILTRGAAGSCGNPPLCTMEELPAVRERELRCACVALGIQPPNLLDYIDGHLPEMNAETMITHILSVVNEVRPQILLSFGPDGLSGHLDHIAVGQWTAEAFRYAKSVAALYTVAVPQSLAQRLDMRQIRPVADEAIALTVDVSSVWETKLAAMHCHTTQWSSSSMMSAPTERQHLFFGREYFVRAAKTSFTKDFLPDGLKGYLL